MKLQSNVVLNGILTITKYNSKKQVISEMTIPNLVVTVGKNHIAQRLYTNSENLMSHMAIGSNNTASALTNTTLGTELARQALTTVAVTGSNISFAATFAAGVGTGSLTEAGIFNASSAGTMLCRTTFPVITKSSSETIAISWTVSVG